MASTDAAEGGSRPDRLDRLMVARGLAPSRERAQSLIQRGLVRVGDAVVRKPGSFIDPSAPIAVDEEAQPYVSRGGAKLERALKHFRLNVARLRCLDVGCAAGGFTECLLRRGAAEVTAVDVGHGQMHPSLRADPRVHLYEGINARYLEAANFPEPFDLAAVDVSFISLTLVLPAVARLVRPGGHILALIKPEFEAGRQAVGSRGVVRSKAARHRAVEKVIGFGSQQLALEVRGVVASALPGAGGNREYFAWFRVPSGDDVGDAVQSGSQADG
ncbi:MAG: TlyA family RNA methyltransferase [Chthonomonadales bacterium]